MFKTIKIRIQRMLGGEYPLHFLIYKLYLKNNIISNKFPYKLYRLLSGKSVSLGSASELMIETYDRLGQATHPSVVSFKDNYYLACTPFPYGNDYYENPCLYRGENGELFRPIEGLCPIALPQSHDKLVYLSDPFLFVEEKELRLLYRECLYSSKQDYEAVIYEMTSADDITWSEPSRLFSSKRGAMSPCILKKDGTEFLYLVMFENEKTSLYRTNIYGQEETRIRIQNEPNNMMLWHLDFFEDADNTIGLFTYSTDHFGSNSKLFLATQNTNGSWEVHKEIILDNRYVKKMYKSCVVELDDGTRNLYVSLRRKDRKWKIYLLKQFDYKIYL